MKNKTVPAGLSATFEVITPQIAKRWLEFNTKNRPITSTSLNPLVFDMKRGQFTITGDPIRFSIDGTLIDGQNRLTAIVNTGVEIVSLVVRGLDKDVFKYIDTGKKRTSADVLFTEGYKNSTQLAAVAKFIIQFNKGKYYSIVGESAKKNITTMISNSDVSDFVELNHSELIESMKYGHTSSNNVMPKVFLSALHFIFNKIDSISADDFCHKAGTGNELKKGDVIDVLRTRFISDLRNKKKVAPHEKAALICKAWNAYRAGKPVINLRWDSIKEAFPKPI